MGQTVGIDGCGRSLEIGVAAVEQLVPESVVVLQTGQPLGMLAQQVGDGLSLGMVGGQHVEYLTHRQDGPSVGASPEESRVGVHGLYPAVTEQLPFGHPHTFGKLPHLSGGLVVIALFTRQPSHIGHGGYAHKHIVEPHRIFLRAQAGEGAVAETVLLVHDVVGIIIYHRPQCGSKFHSRAALAYP